MKSKNRKLIPKHASQLHIWGYFVTLSSRWGMSLKGHSARFFPDCTLSTNTFPEITRWSLYIYWINKLKGFLGFVKFFKSILSIGIFSVFQTMSGYHFLLGSFSFLLGFLRFSTSAPPSPNTPMSGGWRTAWKLGNGLKQRRIREDTHARCGPWCDVLIWWISERLLGPLIL